MKRFSFLLLTVFVALFTINVANAKGGGKVHMQYGGQIAGSEVYFQMNGSSGYYTVTGNSTTRTLKLQSYNPRTGRCVIKVYYKGKYSGTLSGTYHPGDYRDDYYQGTFQSPRGNFSFYLSSDYGDY